MKNLFAIAIIPLFLTACGQTPHSSFIHAESITSDDITSLQSHHSQDIYQHMPQVVRYARYHLVDISPIRAQQYPLERVVQFDFSRSTISTVGEALRYALRDSGYQLYSQHQLKTMLYSHRLPAIHLQSGPARLSVILQLLAGSAWQLEVNHLQRIVCFHLRTDTLKNTQNTLCEN